MLAIIKFYHPWHAHNQPLPLIQGASKLVDQVNAQIK